MQRGVGSTSMPIEIAQRNASHSGMSLATTSLGLDTRQDQGNSDGAVLLTTASSASVRQTANISATCMGASDKEIAMKCTWLSRSVAAATVWGVAMTASDVVGASMDYRSIVVDESPTVCVRLRIPMTAEGALVSQWLSRAEVEIASRLRGENCDRARYVFADEAEFDRVVRAVDILNDALARRSEIIDSTSVTASTRSCVFHGEQLWLQNYHVGVNEEYGDDPSFVVLELGGCDRDLQVRVQFKSPRGPSIGLSYKVPVIDID